MSKFRSWVGVLLVAVAATVDAAPAAAAPEIAVETSPLAPVFRGAGLAVRVRWPAQPRLAFGAGAYAFTLPAVFVDQIAGNADEGWRVAIRPAGHVSADYGLNARGTGVAFGLAVVLARFAITSDEVPGATAYTSLYAVPRVSYTQPLGRRLYLTPSLGVEFHVQVGGDTQLGDRTFEPLTIQPTVGLQLGYILSVM